MSERTPAISPQLVEWLQGRFKNRLPASGTPLRDVDRLIGQQEVIDFLECQMKIQHDSVLVHTE